MPDNAPPALPRQLYQANQVLDAAAFEREQAFHIGRQAYQTASSFSPGVLSGLAVEAAGGEGAWTMTIRPGAAIDAAGALVLLVDRAVLAGLTVPVASGAIAFRMTDARYFEAGATRTWRLEIAAGEASASLQAVSAPRLTLVDPAQGTPGALALADIAVTASPAPPAPLPPADGSPPPAPPPPTLTAEVHAVAAAVMLLPERLPAIDAGRIDGVIPASRIGPIAAAQIEGTLALAQLPVVPADRISAIPATQITGPITEDQVPLLTRILARLAALEDRIGPPGPPPTRGFTFDGSSFLAAPFDTSRLAPAGGTFQALVRTGDAGGELPLVGIAFDVADPAAIAADVAPGTPSSLWLSLLGGAPRAVIVPPAQGGLPQPPAIFTGGSDVAPGAWALVTMTMNSGGAGALYLDARQVAAFSAPPPLLGNLLLLGTQGRDLFQGEAAWFAVWDRPLDPQTIAAMPARMPTDEEVADRRAAGLAGFWPLDRLTDARVPNLVDPAGAAKLAPRDSLPPIPPPPPPPPPEKPTMPANAIRLDDGQWIQVPGVPHLDRLTIEARVRAAAFHGTNWQDALASRHGDGAGWELRLGEAVVRMMVTIGGNHVYAQPAQPGAAPPLPTGEWIHVAGSYDGQTIKTYVDGALVDAQGAGGGITPYDADVTIGRNANMGWGDRFFAGDVAEVRLWDHARSDDEVRGFAGAVLPAAMPGLVFWYPMRDPGGDSVKDASGSGHDGQLRGGQWIGI